MGQFHGWQRLLLTCSIRALVAPQEKGLGVTTENSLKLSTECAKAAQMLGVMRKDIEDIMNVKCNQGLIFLCQGNYQEKC